MADVVLITLRVQTTLLRTLSIVNITNFFYSRGAVIQLVAPQVPTDPSSIFQLIDERMLGISGRN
jgi:hypothetical protein